MSAGGVQSPSEVLRNRSNDQIRWILLDQVNQPGAYVCQETGDLLRVTRWGPPEPESDVVRKHREEPMYVAQISRDPFVPISEARLAAANLDLDIDF